MAEKLYTVLEVAKAQGVEDQTVRSWIMKGKLKAGKINGAYMIREKDLEHYLAAKSKKSAGKGKK